MFHAKATMKGKERDKNTDYRSDDESEEESSEEETSSEEEESVDVKTPVVPIRKKFDDEEDSDDVSMPS